MTIKGGHHTEEAKKKISEAKRQLSRRSEEPLVPQLCACGCGEYAAVDEPAQSRRQVRERPRQPLGAPNEGQAPHRGDQGQARVVAPERRDLPTGMDGRRRPPMFRGTR